MSNKGPTSFRISEEARVLLARLAEALGVSQTSVFEMAIRKLAREELPPEPKRAREPRARS